RFLHQAGPDAEIAELGVDRQRAEQQGGLPLLADDDRPVADRAGELAVDQCDQAQAGGARHAAAEEVGALDPTSGAEAPVEKRLDGRPIGPGLVDNGDHGIVLKRSGLTGTVAIGPVAQALLGTVKSPNPRANDGHAAKRRAASSSRNRVRQHHGQGTPLSGKTNNAFAGAVNGHSGRTEPFLLSSPSTVIPAKAGIHPSTNEMRRHGSRLSPG